jgi:anti-sigma factor RsiW
MFSTPCALLDDYLARDLTVEQERAFEIHLLDCPACHSTVQQQRRLDAMLQEAVRVLDPVPAGLVQRTRARLLKSRRRHYLAYALSASAAAAVIWALFQQGSWLRPPMNAESQPPKQLAQEKATPAPEVRISFADESMLLVVPEQTDSPDVTFVWVYANQRSAPVASAGDANSFQSERNSK